MTRSDIFKYLGTFALGFGCGAGAFIFTAKEKSLSKIMSQKRK